MNKCPNCGSTAQVRLVWQDGDEPLHYHYKEYKCGCGCYFQIEYVINAIKILETEE